MYICLILGLIYIKYPLIENPFFLFPQSNPNTKNLEILLVF